ncbi:metallopeptidase family protein [Corynebacterium uterequi]|uniref:Metallopeptidase family protein n=1 Tax=Corynebacterium uterequi TaxID=1072256 RepID=A0A0G3HLQ6_9CORY|nr:metallopeptidase family protein [Corynebacterium uterequi]AKK12062.1 hypothetical protein CUTER_10490 [Corynebacterium uterequi]
MYRVDDARFDEMVDDALDAIPEAFARRMRNLVVLVEERNDDDPTLLGLYVGTPLPERHHDHTGYLPDTIFIYRDALEEFCSTEAELAEEVLVTVLHEVGHYFGMDEDHLHELGWG